MKLFPWFVNSQWLEQNNLDIVEEIVIEARVLTLKVTSDYRVPKRLHNRVKEFMSRLQDYGVTMFDGGIIKTGDDDAVMFKDLAGTDYLLDPFAPHSQVISGCYYDDIFVLGRVLADAQKPKHLLPIAVYKKDREGAPSAHVNGRRLPLGIEGLADLLFPDLRTDERGFANPKTDDIIPRVVLIKGAVGTGKTTLATQMLIAMARTGFLCDYWCSNDSPQAIRNTALSFKFCSDSEFEGWQQERISILRIGGKYLDYLRLFTEDHSLRDILRRTKGIERTGSQLAEKDVLFVDSLNVSQIVDDMDRQALWTIFESYRNRQLLSMFLLEDYGADGTEKVRQLISDCEFLADIVIELREDSREGYHVKALCIKKKHYGSQVYGTHFYKICSPEHSLPNISEGSMISSNAGIVVYPSIHHYLSTARTFVQGKPVPLVNTGITHLDAILVGGSEKKAKSNIDRGCIEQNSCVVIAGERGGHKLPLGLNLLMGGLWRVDSKAKPKVSPDRDVLLILLDEEADILINSVATARNTHRFTGLQSTLGSLDNGKWIEWMPINHRKHPRKRECDWFGLINAKESLGKKVIFKQWCASITVASDRPKACRKLVIAGFRPGCITPEEFIYIVSRLLKSSTDEPCPFSRVLFVSTAHLKNRFPLLSSSRLFIPAMVDLFKSRDLFSIFVDIIGSGADQELSYGLAALADYIISVDRIAGRECQYTWPTGFEGLDLPGDRQRYIMARMDVENVRGKEYSRACHLVTVRPSQTGQGNDLYILNGNPQGKS